MGEMDLQVAAEHGIEVGPSLEVRVITTEWPEANECWDSHLLPSLAVVFALHLRARYPHIVLQPC